MDMDIYICMYTCIFIFMYRYIACIHRMDIHVNIYPPTRRRVGFEIRFGSIRKAK